MPWLDKAVFPNCSQDSRCTKACITAVALQERSTAQMFRLAWISRLREANNNKSFEYGWPPDFLKAKILIKMLWLKFSRRNVWKKWHKKTWKPLTNKYIKFVTAFSFFAFIIPKFAQVLNNLCDRVIAWLQHLETLDWPLTLLMCADQIKSQMSQYIHI